MQNSIIFFQESYKKIIFIINEKFNIKLQTLGTEYAIEHLDPCMK